MHIEWNYVREVILTHEKQFKKSSHFSADKLLRPTLREIICALPAPMKLCTELVNTAPKQFPKGKYCPKVPLGTWVTEIILTGYCIMDSQTVPLWHCLNTLRGRPLIIWGAWCKTKKNSFRGSPTKKIWFGELAKKNLFAKIHTMTPDD